MNDYIFILYSCQKNLDKAEQIYKHVNTKLNKCKVYIIYGDMTIEEDKDYKIIDDKYIIFKCLDDYEHLSDKTILLLNTISKHFPLIKGLFKCDDDIIVNIKHINKIINDLSTDDNGRGDYIGNPVIKTKKDMDKFADNYYVPICSYCAGPLYFLSRKALDCFLDINNVVNNYYEDVLVGYHLNQFSLFPSNNIDYILYSDKISDSPNISYHNKQHINEVYFIVKGGLGNQLFQLACAITMADKYNKKVVLNTRAIKPNPHQHFNNARTVNTLKRLFPVLEVSNEKLYPEYFHKFDEMTNDCFLFIEEKLEECFSVYTNVVLEGYFINPKYIPSSLQNDNMFNQAQITPDDKTLLYVNFENTYFIHIRLGDFVNNKLYTIDLTKYYIYCINDIKECNPQAKFYICTNQFDTALLNYLKSFPKGNEYKVQSKTNNDIDTLYIMSSCRGAVCSNSTLSYWGAYFQKDKNRETIFMPYPFVSFIDGFNAENVNKSMYPEWSRVYDTLS